ncbi:SsgA family sporulation/cell division regulator [Streptomyces gobiensis]|uniref:SsgA family sporulation/cell division regulator n=1 Tax=Streptomyces gobiensis TaxID=2875706 RepID=UPI001E3C3843|nr:SsgA family sporulation/cell division regulator [Streptomyces gobiensis]UGY91875.1 SsgA family sporulation/cell division regulator [Streptomyces gobiensis]
MSTLIDHTMQARIIAQPAAFPIFGALRYDSADPLAVQLIFPAEVALDGAEVTWVFARELLDGALCDPVGTGDVQLWPNGPDRTMVELQAPEGTALVELPTRDVRHFLRRTYALVPAAEEHLRLHVDRGLADLLRGV